MQLNNASLEPDNVSPLRSSRKNSAQNNSSASSPLRASGRASADKRNDSPMKQNNSAQGGDFNLRDESSTQRQPGDALIPPALEEQLQKINIENTSLEQ